MITYFDLCSFLLFISLLYDTTIDNSDKLNFINLWNELKGPLFHTLHGLRILILNFCSVISTFYLKESNWPECMQSNYKRQFNMSMLAVLHFEVRMVFSECHCQTEKQPYHNKCWRFISFALNFHYFSKINHIKLKKSRKRIENVSEWYHTTLTTSNLFKLFF